ncbi:MAG: hypothetical protein QG641_2858, partial [Candidatus Poribacteria bacterium]|nr:hypothetical protein [Candidatus Poribacteria bacterium]
NELKKVRDQMGEPGAVERVAHLVIDTILVPPSNGRTDLESVPADKCHKDSKTH